MKSKYGHAMIFNKCGQCRTKPKKSNKPTGEGAEGDSEVTYKDIIISDAHYT